MIINGKEVSVQLSQSKHHAMLVIGDRPILELFDDGTARLVGGIPEDNPEGIKVNQIGQIRLT
jgi:hypothetical protein